MPFEPLYGRRSPAPQGTALLGVGDDTSSAGVDEFFARLRRGLTEPLPGASPMSSGKLMVDPNRAAAVPMALADMVKRVVMDAAGGWSDAYDMAAAGAEPHEYGPEVFKAASAATVGGFGRGAPSGAVGMGAAASSPEKHAQVMAWARKQPEFGPLVEKHAQRLRQAEEAAPAGAAEARAAWDLYIERRAAGEVTLSMSGGGRASRPTPDYATSFDYLHRLMSQRPSLVEVGDWKQLAQQMNSHFGKEGHWSAARVREMASGMPRPNKAAAPESALERAVGPAAEQEATAEQVVVMLKEMGAKGISVRRGSTKSGKDETLYIDFERGDHRAMPTTIRIPKPGRSDHGITAHEGEVGRVFDMTRSPTANPRFAENAGMGPLADIDNLREVVKWRLSKSPDGQWLVSPDHAPSATRRLPGEPRPAPPAEGPDLHPDQLRLLSGGVPVASLNEAPEKPPPYLKVSPHRFYEQMNPESPSSQPRRERPPIRPLNPRRIRMAGVDEDQWEAFESMSAFARSLDPGFTSIPLQ